MTARILILLGALLHSNMEAGDVSSFSMNKKAPPQEATLTLAGNKTIQISYDRSTDASTIKSGTTILGFPSSHQVRQIKADSKGRVAVLLVYRWDRKLAGWYYVGLLSVRSIPESLSFTWHLTDLEMLQIDGRRRAVGEILSVEDFPQLDLRVHTYKQPDGKTGTETIERTWNALSNPAEAPSGG